MEERMKEKVVKKILNPGKGPLPSYASGTKTLFHYKVLKPIDISQGMPKDMDAYTIIDDTSRPYPHGFGEALELVMGKKFQLPILELCLTTMLVKERSQFDIDASELCMYPMMSKKLRDISHDKCTKGGHRASSHMCAAAVSAGTGYPELDELMKTSSPLRFIIDLLQVQEAGDYEAEGWQLNADEKLESVEKLKERGNQYFREGNYAEAIDKYREALGRLDTLILREKPGDEEWKELDDKNVPLYLNLSQCYLKVGNFYEAEETATEALNRDETNEKALYRRAKARIGIWSLDKAEADLEQLRLLNPSMDKLIEKDMEVINERREEKKEELKMTSKNMLRAMGQ